MLGTEMFRKIALAMVLVCSPGAGIADSDLRLTLHALLVDAEGRPLDGTVRVDASVFEARVGGRSLWSESHPDVTVERGVATIVLGSAGNPMRSSHFSGGTRWVELVVDGEPLGPRQVLSALATLDSRSLFLRLTLERETDLQLGAPIPMDHVITMLGPTSMNCKSDDASAECWRPGWHFVAPVSGTYVCSLNLAIRHKDQLDGATWPPMRGAGGARLDAVIMTSAAGGQAVGRVVLADDRSPTDHFLQGTSLVSLARGEAAWVVIEAESPPDPSYVLRLDPADGNTLTIALAATAR